MSEHAYCSPSGWDGWSVCAGQPALEEHEPDNANEFSAAGTHKHEVAAVALVKGDTRETSAHDDVMRYTRAVRDRVAAYKQAGATSVELLVEQKLDISIITGEKGAKGTADTIIIAEFADYSALDVWDAKFGMRDVKVENNGQCQIYALAALLKFSLLHNFTEVNIVIHQPNTQETPKEWRTTPEALYVFGQKVTEAAGLALSLRGQAAALSHLVPGAHCKKTFCKALYRCPAYAKMVSSEVFGDFQDLADPTIKPVDPLERVAPGEDTPKVLGLAMSRVGMIESWCLAVRAHVDSELQAGRPIPGWKLVEGRRGARQFKDEKSAEALLLADGCAESTIYAPKKLKTPTQLEKLISGSPLWERLQELIEQKEGKPSVAPEDDDRPAYTPAAVGVRDFDSLDASDLV